MQKFRFRHSSSSKVAKAAKTTANEGFPAANQLLRVANVTGADNEKSETLAVFSRPLASQDTSKNNDLSKISRISSIPCTISEKRDPAPPPAEPKGLGPGYKRQWKQAWTLADEIDNPQGAPLSDRRARLPELNQLRDELARLEKAVAATNGAWDPKGQWTTWEDTAAGPEYTVGNCPARCKKTGKCYGKAFFECKPGPAKECDQDGCKWILPKKEIRQ